MDREFWLARWEARQIGFHLPQVNPRLLAHRATLPKAPARVFVPLSGKSLDLTWLAEQGYDVVGVELSELAVQSFFAEQGASPTVTREGELDVYRAGRVTLYQGDFFSLSRAAVGEIAAFYDRAALIALPPAQRARYAAHLAQLISPAAVGLTVTFEYPQAEMPGPPFSVAAPEVSDLFGGAFEVECLASYDILSDEARFREAGLSTLHERVYRLVRRG